jgi:hypothetical protein
LGVESLKIYIRFLEHAKGMGKYWHAAPMEVARWWREREEADNSVLQRNHGSTDVVAADRSLIADLKINRDTIQFVSR